MPPTETSNSIPLLQIYRPKIAWLCVIAVFVFFFAMLISGPQLPNVPTIVSVTRGESIRQIARELKEAEIIRSAALFTFLIQISDNPIVATGDYAFTAPQNIFTVVKRFTTSRYDLPTVQVTITEGLTVKEISEKLATQFEQFDKGLFLELALPYEGYLFPDTYIFNNNATANEIFTRMKHTFDSKIDSLGEIITDSPYTLDQIVTMASIVEREATADSRQEVANILWNRFEIGMALQVDASFVYGIGKATADLTTADLETDGPYNTYKNVGLTPTPISNPGLESIKAAANPQPTDMLYFLTGRDGNMYYAKTFEGHKRNRALYLD